MDGLDLTSYLIKVTYSFHGDNLNVKWSDLRALPWAARKVSTILQRNVSVARRAVGITTTFAHDRLKLPLVPVNPKGVLFQVTVREDDDDAFKTSIELKEMEKKLQGVFTGIEKYLKETIGDHFDELEADVIEELRAIKVMSLELCEREGEEETFNEFADDNETSGKAKVIPLPPSGIKVTSSEYPNTAPTVVFDDPNQMACEYIITARDTDSAEEISVKSDANFGVLKDLRPGRRYVIYAQCISNDVKSKMTFYGQPIDVFGGRGQSAPSITDSAYRSESSRTVPDQGLKDDGASVLTTSELKLGEEAETSSNETGDLRQPRNSSIHDALKSVFPSVTPSKMKSLLKKCADLKIQKQEDLQNFLLKSMKDDYPASLEKEKTNMREYHTKFVHSTTPIKQGKQVYKGRIVSEERKQSQSKSQEVAIKLVKKSDLDEESDKHYREPSNLMDLHHHPNVVAYVHCGEADLTFFYIIMELCDEDSLHDRIEDPDKYREELDDDEYCKCLILQIAQGLHHIHKNQIIHRDIKPPNILFSRDSIFVKIGDFGFSKKLQIGKDATSQSSNTKGTDGWRCPETYKDQETTKKADIFSFGLVTYYVLSGGAHAFGPISCEWVSNIMMYKGMWIGNLKVSDPSIARDLIKKMLNEDQSKRPSVEEILSHPYFWSFEKKIGLYQRVVDELSYAEMSTRVERVAEEISCADIATRESSSQHNEDQGNVHVNSDTNCKAVGKPACYDDFFNEAASKRALENLETQINHHPTKGREFLVACAKVYAVHNYQTGSQSGETTSTDEPISECSAADWICRVIKIFTLQFRDPIKKPTQTKPTGNTPRDSNGNIGTKPKVDQINGLKLKRKFEGLEKWNEWLEECGKKYVALTGIKDKKLSTGDITKLRVEDDIIKWMRGCLSQIPTSEVTNTDGLPEDLQDIETQVRKIIRKERKGEEKTWKFCLEYEGNRRCVIDGRLDHEAFVKNAQRRDDNIFALLEYVQDAFAHFGENKKIPNSWKCKEDLWEFVSSAVPELFPHVYNSMKGEFPEYTERRKQSNYRLPVPNSAPEEHSLPPPGSKSNKNKLPRWFRGCFTKKK